MRALSHGAMAYVETGRAEGKVVVSVRVVFLIHPAAVLDNRPLLHAADRRVY
jgi:hypothetical protein